VSPSDLTEEQKELVDVFGHKSSKDFFTSISGRSCSGDLVAVITEYSHDDYSCPHTDFRTVRSTNFVWHLSKDWDPNWGGAFFWGNSRTLQEGYFYPTFNSLVLFLPTMTSTHYVTPINHMAKGRRLSISGKYHSLQNDAINIQEPIEQVYTKHLNLNSLTYEEASWITRKLDPVTYTHDQRRHQALRDLKDFVMPYLYPQDDSAFVVTWEDDGEEDQQDQTQQQSEDLTIAPDSSIVDFLDPSILEDDDLLSEIRSNLLKGKLVIIQDAFTAEFAEYAWRQLDRDDVVWKKEHLRVDGEEPGCFSSRHVIPDASSMSPKLRMVLDVFENIKSKEFLEGISGRSLANIPSLNPNWFKQYDYSNPHADTQYSLQFVWYLSKDWDPTYGGAFYWFPSSTLEGGYHYPKFNALYLMLPTPSTIHAVTPVAWWAENKLLSIAGFYDTNEEAFRSLLDNGDLLLEETFADENDYIKIPPPQARWIVEDMVVSKITEDPVRQQKLMELKDKMSTKYLNPSSGNIYTLESVEKS